MRSRRRRLEYACRVGVFALMGWLLGASLIRASGRRLERATTANVASRLAAWTRLPANVALHGDFATTPAAWIVDWLDALQRSGHLVTWSGSPPALAVTAEDPGDPSGSGRIEGAAPPGSRVVLRDEAGVIDSIHVARLGGSVTSPLTVGSVDAIAGNEVARVASPDSTRARAIVVAGGASWEGKFIVAALEERGWPVIAR